MPDNTLIGSSELLAGGKKTFKTEIDSTTPAPTIYANLAGVVGTANEVCVEFALVSPPFNVTETKDTNVIKAPVVVRVLLPRPVAHQLVEILESNFAQNLDVVTVKPTEG